MTRFNDSEYFILFFYRDNMIVHLKVQYEYKVIFLS
jgi:hypothetical protein